MITFVKLTVLAVLLAAACLGVRVTAAVADVVNVSSRSVLQNEGQDEEQGDQTGEEDHGDHDHGDYDSH